MKLKREDYEACDSITLRRIMKNAPSPEARQMAYGVLINRRTAHKKKA